MSWVQPLRTWFDHLNNFEQAELPICALHNATQLAQGYSPILILLLEPPNSADHVDFNTMEQSPTIIEVYRLIENEWGVEPRSVSIFDVRPLISERRRLRWAKEKQQELEEQGYYVLEECINLKQPDVILTLQCQTSRAESDLAKRICSSEGGSSWPIAMNLQRNTTILIKGFHPSTYLRDDYTADLSADARALRRSALQARFRAALLASKGQRLNPWSSVCSTKRPWYWLRIMVAQRNGLSDAEARRLTPSDILRMFNLDAVPKVRERLLQESQTVSTLEHIRLKHQNQVSQIVSVLRALDLQ